MIYPNTVILATGGTHGDFLLKSCQIMTNGKILKSDVQDSGRVNWESHFKKNMNGSFSKGKKIFIDTKFNYFNEIELSHVYYNEFNDWSSKFFYVEFNKEVIDTILDMYIQKVCYNNIDKILFHLKEYIADDLCKKINKQNYREVMRTVWWNSIQKYKQIKNIQKIDIESFYTFGKMCEVLKELKVYNEFHSKIYEIFYQEWYKKNEKFIKNIIKK